MERIQLNNLNPAFRLHGNEKRRGVHLQKMVLHGGPAQNLQLQIIDEKDITVFTQPLNFETNKELTLNLKFAFYDHLTVQIQCLPPVHPFDVEVFFE